MLWVSMLRFIVNIFHIDGCPRLYVFKTLNHCSLTNGCWHSHWSVYHLFQQVHTPVNISTSNKSVTQHAKDQYLWYQLKETLFSFTTTTFKQLLPSSPSQPSSSSMLIQLMMPSHTWLLCRQMPASRPVGQDIYNIEQSGISRILTK